MTGSTAQRWLFGLVVAVGAVVVPAAPALASQAPGPVSLQRAPNDLPDVHGLSVADTRKVLQSWNKGVIIFFDPDLKQLPKGATEANVVAVRDTLVTASSPQELKEFSAAGPRVLVTLGAVMPDLTGLDAQNARNALADRGLALDATPARPATDWVVTGQAYPPGSPAEFGVPVPAAFGPPAAPPLPQPDPTGLPVWLLVAIALAAVVVLMLVLATTLIVRGGKRGGRDPGKNQDSNRDRDRDKRPPERIEVHAFAGQVIGPDVFDVPSSVAPTSEVRS